MAAALCVGGICIPYSAILPFFAVALKWIVELFIACGLLPSWLVPKEAAARQKVVAALLTLTVEDHDALCRRGSARRTDTRQQGRPDAPRGGRRRGAMDSLSKAIGSKLCNSIRMYTIAMMTNSHMVSSVSNNFARLQ